MFVHWTSSSNEGEAHELLRVRLIDSCHVTTGKLHGLQPACLASQATCCALGFKTMGRCASPYDFVPRLEHPETGDGCGKVGRHRNFTPHSNFTRGLDQWQAWTAGVVGRGAAGGRPAPK